MLKKKKLKLFLKKKKNKSKLLFLIPIVILSIFFTLNWISGAWPDFTYDVYEDFEDNALAGGIVAYGENVVNSTSTYFKSGAASGRTNVTANTGVPSSFNYDTSVNNYSTGFWFMSPPAGAILAGAESSIFMALDSSYSNYNNLKIYNDSWYYDDKRYYLADNSYLSQVEISPSSWYWVTFQYKRNNYYNFLVYNTTYSLIFNVSGATTDDSALVLSLGKWNSDFPGQGVVYFDDWVIDTTDATFPLLGWEEGITPISSCANITSAGNYDLTADIIDSNNPICMNILTDNVNLDCGNHLIDANPSLGSLGIAVYSLNNISISNCILRDWNATTIDVDHSNNTNISNIIIHPSSRVGVYLWYAINSTLKNITSYNSVYGLISSFSKNVIVTNSNFSDNYLDFLLRAAKDECPTLQNITGTGGKPIYYHKNSPISINNWNNNVSAIFLCNASNSTISNVNIIHPSRNSSAISLISSDYSLLNNSIIVNCSGCILSRYSNFNRIENSSVLNGNEGIYMDFGNNNTIINFKSKNTGFAGINLYNVNSSDITQNIIETSPQCINVDWDTTAYNTHNKVYNNLLNCTYPLNFFDGAASRAPTYWNITSQAGTRIYSSGTNIGGNYITNSAGNAYSDTCADADTDGFCDAPYDLYYDRACAVGVNCTSNAVDFLPLSDEYVAGENPFSSIWNTSKLSTGSSNDTTISLPLYDGGTYNFTVNWGDGNVENVTSYLQNNHTYAAAGIYTVNITGTIIGFRFNNLGDKDKIQNITQWGDLRVGNSNGYFYGCTNLTSSATDALNLTGTTTLYYAFRGATSFNGNISNWNTSSVTNMYAMFRDATSFNQNLNNWDTSKVTTMYSMFNGATSFNGNISNWNTSSVTLMNIMFDGADSFNQNLNNWDTSKVTTMGSMFASATSFNGNISNWNTSSVNSMILMFDGADSFNQNLNNWDTSKVTTMGNMFSGATSFNQNLNNWDTSTVTNMQYMFDGATAFNGNISSWNVSRVSNMQYMFDGDSLFNQDLSNWDTGNVTSFYTMFRGATSFNHDLGNWNVSRATNLGRMFDSVTLSTENYDSILQGWASRFEQNNTIFSGGNSKYSNCPGTGNESRSILINTYNWSITDGGWNSSYVCPVANPPQINFTLPTPSNATTTSNTSIFVNVTSSSSVDHSVFLDWNNSLVGWWNFDSRNSTHVLDNSTYKNDGLVYAGVTYNFSGARGGSANFNEAGYIDLEMPASLNINSTGTVSAWVKTSQSGYPVVISNENWVTERNGVALGFGDGQIIFDVCDNSNNVFVMSPSTYHNNQWHLITGTLNGTHLNLYVDGVLSASELQSLNPISGVYNWTIGKDPNSANNFFNGSIDEVMIWNRALNPSEISALYNASVNKYYNNFTNLSTGTYNYKAYAIDASGEINSTETRSITITAGATAGNNNWICSSTQKFSNASCWSLGHVPIALENITFNSSGIGICNITNNTMPQNLGSFTVESTYSGAIHFAPLFAVGNWTGRNDGTQLWNITGNVLINNGTMYIYGDYRHLTFTGIRGNITNDGHGQEWNSVLGNITIGNSVLLNGTGLGFPSTVGPGYGGNYGAGYGGIGGGGLGMTYGNEKMPTSLGSGGWGWAAGSAIKLQADVVIINGSITMEGLCEGLYGGGSGGSILIIANNIIGNGLISTAGDTCGQQWAGAGGRIAFLSSGTMNYSGIIDNDGGFGTLNLNSGGGGTVYINATNSIISSMNISIRGENGGNITLIDTLLTLSGIYNATPYKSSFSNGSIILNYTDCSSSFTGAKFYPPAIYQTLCLGNNCTYSGSGNWVIRIEDNCTIGDNDIGANVLQVNGTCGTLTVNGTTLAKQIFRTPVSYNGCFQIIVKPGGTLGVKK
jgi:surface protein